MWASKLSRMIDKCMWSVSRWVSSLARFGVESDHRRRLWQRVDERPVSSWLTAAEPTSSTMVERSPAPASVAHPSHWSHPYWRRRAGRSTSKWTSAQAYTRNNMLTFIWQSGSRQINTNPLKHTTRKFIMSHKQTILLCSLNNINNLKYSSI